jgi:hypothetical protein
MTVPLRLPRSACPGRAFLLAILTVTGVICTDSALAAQLTLNWVDNASDEYGFRIERRPGTTGTYSIVATVSPVTTYTDTGLADTSTYCYRVSAYNGNGISAPSNEACATTGAVSSVLLTVAKGGTGAGTVSGPGIDCGADCSESVANGTTVSLAATPATGSVFTGWSGGGCGGLGTCTLTLSIPTTVTATFNLQTYLLTVAKAGSGSGTVSGPGIDCGADCSESVANGTTVTLTASPAVGSVFTGWSGACGGTGSCTVVISATTTVTATFDLPLKSVTVTRGGAGSGTVSGPGINCGSDCSETVPSGTTLTLTAAAAPGSTFTGWSGACGGTGSCTMTVWATTIITASFGLAGPTSPPLQIVTGAGPSEVPRVRGFAKDGTLAGPDFLAYASTFTGGVFVAVGRLDASGERMLVTGNGPGNPAEVRIYQTDGSWTGLAFQPYGARFKGGVRIATCDIDGDGVDEVVTAPGPGRQSTVTVWKVAAGVTKLLTFNATKGINGLYVACGDVDGDGRAEVVVAQDTGGTSDVQVYGIQGTKATQLTKFSAYPSGFTGGVRVGVVDVDGDGRAEIVTVPGPGAAPTVKVFRVVGSSASLVTSFLGAEPELTGGLFVAGGSWDATEGADVLVAPGPGGPPYVRVFAVSPVVAIERTGFYAGDPASLDGVAVAVDR